MYDSVRDVIGPKWVLEILDLLNNAGTLNYTDIEAEINTSPDVVSNRLQLLTQNGLINRAEQSKRDVRYSINDDGRTVLQHIKEIESLLSS